MPTFYAHSTKSIDRSDWQGLAEHLNAVSQLAAQCATFFSAGPLAEVAGLFHDLGKYTQEFQQRLSGDYGRVDHSTWGARIVCEQYGPLGKLLAYGIAGHHAGLANGRDAGTRTSLADRLRVALPELQPEWRNELAIPDKNTLKPPVGFCPKKERGQFQLAFLGRMVFSCLVDADYLDTEAFYNRAESRPDKRPKAPLSLLELRERLSVHLARFSADSPVNQLRAEILAGVRERASLAPGLFSLTVPTGGGKTLASLAFALDHAIAHGLRRVIFVIPFTSIVEQNAAVFRHALGDLGEQAVLEHHSAFIDDPKRNRESRDKLHLAMENWDYPIIVTTSVQFFESLFAARPSACRKLHNVSSSVVILDEAQSLPLKLLRPCVAAIDELALNYRTSLVLCTATQPALAAEAIKGNLQEIRELAPEPARLFQALERVRVKHLGELDDAALVEQLSSREQVLCIVNNRRHARALYEQIAEQPGACHLSTLMCAKHRSAVLAEVRQRLIDGLPCRLVSTSLIEAGVDVDFPTVLRAEAGLDSIAQAAGRCNREGKRPINDSEVLIFTTANPDWRPPTELVQFAQAAREVLRMHADDPLGMEAIQGYFSLLYWQKGAQALDAHNLLGRIEDGKLEGIPFEFLAEKFRMIENTQRPIIIPYDNVAEKALQDLAFAKSCAGIARSLQPYVVQVPQAMYVELERLGAIQAIASERYGEQFMALAKEINGVNLYNPNYGISLGDTGPLIW